MTNPLIGLNQLPPFDQIEAAHMLPAIKDIIERSTAQINQLVTNTPDPTWQNLIIPLEEIGDELDRAWSPISHLNAVVNSDEIREAYNQCLPILSEYSTAMGQNRALFEAISKLHDSADALGLDQVQKKILRDDLRDFKLAGVHLDGDKQKQYGNIRKRLSELSAKFSENVMDATMAWTYHTLDKSELAGMPDSAVAAAAQAAKSKDLEGYLITLEYPSYHAVITYADNRELREAVYRAYSTKASDEGPNAGDYDNSQLMSEILQLRQQLAALLGFESYANLSLATKMASTPEEVFDFMTELAERSLPQARAEIEALQHYAQHSHDAADLQAWDLSYYSEKLKIERHDISQEALRPWFPEDKVIDGLFKITATLFNVSFVEVKDFASWHPDVRFFNILDADGNHQASFYLDLYARPNKRGGAWMADCIGRRKSPAGIQKPVAFLTCNFNGPVGDNPALFTHDEVTTLFHEFGHGLHHMLTRIDHAAVAGISGVPWDAVELPSQFLENFCWCEEGLAIIARHFETDEPLSAEQVEKLLAAKNFMSAMQMVRQLEFSLFDFELHTNTNDKVEVQAVLDDVRRRVAVFKAPEFNRFQHSFGHIFAGGYAAGYYSYKWAEVLSSDAFSRFEEEGVFNPKTGRDFLENILEKGGSEEPAVLFERFRGRKPSIDALLRHSGIG